MCGPGVVKRTDQRLHDTCGAVEGAQIRPAFQRMGQRQMPGATRCGLVVVKTEMGRKWYSWRSPSASSVSCGCFVDWIDVDNNERLRCAGTDIRGEPRATRPCVLSNVRIDRINEVNRRAEYPVDAKWQSACTSADWRRAGQNHCFAWSRFQIVLLPHARKVESVARQGDSAFGTVAPSSRATTIAIFRINSGRNAIR